MRKTSLIVASLTFIAGGAFAADDCSCTCSGVEMRRAVSESQPREGYFMRDGKVMVFRNGVETEMSQEVTLDNGMRFTNDGTLILADGTRTRLRDNQWMSMDGRFYDRNERERVNASHRIENTRDGYFLGRNGKVMAFRDGRLSEITSDITFDTGARLSVDGTLIMKDGTRSKIDNTQFLTFDGKMNEKTNSDNRAAKDVSNDRNQNNANTNNANSNANNDNRNQNERRENKTESQPNTTPPAKTPDIKNDANQPKQPEVKTETKVEAQPKQPEVKTENKVETQPNTNAAQTPDIKNDANQPKQPEVKTENKVEAQPSTTTPANTPETKKNNDEQK